EGSTDLFDLKKAEMELSIAQETFDKTRKEMLEVWDEYLALPEEVQARQAGQDKAAWAQRGLAARTRVRSAEAQVESAHGRLETARKRLASIPKDDPGFQEADVARPLAEDDVANAEIDLALARDYNARDTWNQAGTK